MRSPICRNQKANKEMMEALNITAFLVGWGVMGALAMAGALAVSGWAKSKFDQSAQRKTEPR
jgi:hypothetical protein